MKYLKSYKLFESNWYDIKDHLNVLADMSLPLWDRDFNVQVADEIISREHQCVVVNIVKKGSTKFTFSVIKEELLEMVDYMDSEGWEVLNIAKLVKRRDETKGIDRRDSSFPFFPDLIVKTNNVQMP